MKVKNTYYKKLKKQQNKKNRVPFGVKETDFAEMK